MCGIVGLSLEAPHPNAAAVVREMSRRIAHRGPDSDGHFCADHERAHLGFRRLAIRDLNPRANQPMHSASSRSAIVFNGEVYNSQELADRYLPDAALRTSCDTEVVLECIERHGLDVISDFNGMFSLAFMNRASGEITLTRDRMGKKPLYIFQHQGVVAFAAELRSLKPFGLTVDPTYAGLYFHLGYFPSPYTFFRDTTQVCPGEIVQIADGKIQGRHFFHQFTDADWSCDDLDLDQLDHTLRDATQLRKLSDVPLGAFLSGGVDSALVAAHLRDGDGEPIPTFTIAFADQSHNEAVDAASTAAELGLPNTKIEIEEGDLAQLAIDFQDCYEQPYADTSGLVTMLLCDAVKQHVTVALSGDGGDEFFGGYSRYAWFRKALLTQHLPRSAQKLAAWGIAKADSRRGHRLASWLTARDPAGLYAEIMQMWNATDTQQLLNIDRQAPTAEDLIRQVFDRVDSDPLAKAACFDATYYIPDDLQVKLDRASMRVALEVRCPLLDYRVADHGIRLRTKQKYRHGLKTTLKDLLGRHVSAETLNRPKQGFSVPLDRWLRGPMRPLVEDTLQQQAFRECGWMQPETAQRVWQEYLDGKPHATSVWLMLSTAHHLRPPQQDPLFGSLLRGKTTNACTKDSSRADSSKAESSKADEDTNRAA